MDMRISGKKGQRPSWAALVLLCLVCAIAAGLGVRAWTIKQYGEKYENPLLDKIRQIESLLDTYYVGEYDRDALMDVLAYSYIGGINDKWAYYTTAENLAALREHQTGHYVGIGITIVQDEETGALQVVDVTPGSSAEEVGIEVSDLIWAVEGELVSVLGMDTAISKVRGEEGTTVNLTIKRNGILHKMAPVRKKVSVISVTYELIDGQIGYLRISEFSQDAKKQFQEKLEKLIESGAQALIVDVRNNPGGSLETLIGTLDHFVPEGEIFVMREKGREEQIRYVDKTHYDLPMVVLVNHNSYSAAEYFAAVLQEKERAYVIGTATSGKGEAQTTFVLDDGSAISFSTIKYFTPNRVSLADEGGMVPDLVLELSAEEIAQIGRMNYTEDRQIMEAIGYLRTAFGLPHAA